MSEFQASAQTECDESSIDTEQLERLEAALLTLPRFRREVFLANRLDNLSCAEIARITGASERRVRREMARALSGILRAMDGELTRSRWWNLW